MTKTEAIRLFDPAGGKPHVLAGALSISRQAIAQWPEELTQRQADEVIGAAIRLNVEIPDHLLRSSAA